MNLPILVNIELLDGDNDVNIATAVLDFHYTVIRKFTNCYDGFTMIYYIDNSHAKVLLPFDVVYNIYNEQQRIDETHKKYVEEIKKDNFLAQRDKLRNGKKD